MLEGLGEGGGGFRVDRLMASLGWGFRVVWGRGGFGVGFGWVVGLKSRLPP